MSVILTKMNVIKTLPLLLRQNSSTKKPTTTELTKLFHSCISNCRKKSHHDCTYPPQPPSGGYKPYKFLFWLAAVPAIIGMSLWNYREYEHKKKCYQRPPFVKYPYMYRRTHRFMWGDGNKTLFHNKEKNALPEGYED
ncbi:cytochrome c oxidase subunit 6A1, mitochondrial-like [Coccinella septempunctata]|uniref:cytochrome c oxidase subunit 6A1, mitochondrial-like n=1 Tax=Coccinella septempunctata TaxID=41139 RepID=UPI001D069DFC|nr:cytochrome c oxidase subunit 6A1, mitochondrial-like [Coccinella septempunctata]